MRSDEDVEPERFFMYSGVIRQFNYERQTHLLYSKKDL